MAEKQNDGDRGGMPKLPAVVRHTRKGDIGVATKAKKVGSTRHYYICRINGNPDTNSTWSEAMIEFYGDKAPAELGYKTPSDFVPIYVRNAFTGEVGVATGDTFQNRRPAYAIRRPDGSRNSRWYVENCIEITEEEYEAADKAVKRRRGANAKKATGAKRKCRACGKPIQNGNWWWCATCHARKSVSVVEDRPNSADPR